MRLNVALMIRDSVLTVNVFAVPGTPSTRAWPSASKAIRICSIASSCPTITFLSSLRMCSTVEATVWVIFVVLYFVLCSLHYLSKHQVQSTKHKAHQIVKCFLLPGALRAPACANQDSFQPRAAFARDRETAAS